MPAFSNYTPLPSLSLLPGDTTLPKVEAAPTDNPLGRLFDTVNIELPDFAKPKNAALSKPVLTTLSETLRYTDPSLGFNPTDTELEYKYADAHPYKTFGNNMIQFGARFLGAATEAIATIPIAVNAAWNKDFSKMYDNPVTNSISDWLDTLNTSLPTYRTRYEEEHPVLKYLGVGGLNATLGAWGGAVNNLGYTAGAIAGALIEDTIITGLTGGVGLLPALGTNVAQIYRGFTKAGRIAATAAEETKALTQIAYGGVGRSAVRASELAAEGVDLTTEGAKVAAQQAKLLPEIAGAETRALAKTNEVGAFTGGGTSVGFVRGKGDGLYQSFGSVDEAINAKNGYLKRIDFRDAAYKLRDGVKYNLALLTSASAEGAFEAAENNKQSIKELSARYKDYYGVDPDGQDLANIYKQAKEGANFVMGSNIALLYLSNRVNWGSLFKPTNNALTEGITGWGKNITRTGIETKFVPVTNEVGEEVSKKIVHSVMNVAPETRIGKILLNGEKLLTIGKRNINESFEEGAQYALQEGATDYVKRKYDPTNTRQVGEFMKSFGYGVNKTISTNEGLDNMVGGFVGGLLGGGVQRRIQKQAPLKEQLAQQVTALNSTQLFGDNIMAKGHEAVIGQSLAKDHKDAVVKGDIHKAKNLKFDMLYNWVTTGLRVGNYEKRIEELDMSRELEGKSFADYWGVEDNADNRTKVNEFLDGVKEKSDRIKKNYEKVNNVTKNPHQKGSEDYAAFEEYKNQLSLNLSRHEEYQRRLKAVRTELTDRAPLLDIQNAVKLTSVQGINEMMGKLEKASNDLAEQIRQTEGNAELQKDLFVKKQAIDDVFGRLQPLVYAGKTQPGSMRVRDVDFQSKDYVKALRDLYNLTNGIDLQNNAYIDQQKKISDGKTIFIESAEENATDVSDDEFADILQRLQDVYKLGDASYNIGKYYTYLRKGKGMTEEMAKIKKIMAEARAAVNEKTGKIETPEDKEEAIRQEEYTNIDTGDLEISELDTLKSAAKKEANDKPLTPEETAAKEKNPDIFVEFLDAEQRVKNSLYEDELDEALGITKTEREAYRKAQEEGTTAETKTEAPVTAEGATKVQSDAKFNGVSPNTLFLGLQGKEEFLPGIFRNLHNLLFNTPIDEIGKRFSAIVTTRPAGKRNINPVDRSNPNLKLFRRDFDNVIQINEGGRVIGELRPPSSLFLSRDLSTPLFDKNGKLVITEENYTDITQNDISTYQEFKETAENYYKSYTALYDEIQKTGKASSKTIRQLFKFSINGGSTVLNKPQDSDQDTVLKDVNIRNTAVVKIENVNGTYVANMLTNMGLTNAQIEQIKTVVENNQDHFKTYSGKMMAIFPTAGTVTKQGFVRARFINDKQTEVNKNTIKVISPADIFQNFSLNFVPKTGTTETETQETVTTAPTPKVANWQKDIASIKEELNKLNTKEEKLEWLKTNNYLDPFVQDGISSNYLKNATGRVVVKIKIGDIIIPFYISTGQGEKADVQTNKWYVFFGQGKDGWFNKTSGKDINDQYGVEVFKQIAEILNSIGSNKDEYKAHEDSKGFMNLKWSVAAETQLQTVIDFITPIQPNPSPDGPKATPEQIQQLKDNIQLVKDRVAAELEKLNNESKGTTTEATQEPTVETPVEPTFVKNKKALVTFIKDNFGVTQEQAEASADLFEAQAKAWAKRTGKPVSEYYKTIRFGTKEAFYQAFGENVPEDVKFSKDELTKIQKEVEQLKTDNLQYPAGKTNLDENLWYVTQTPTFKAWFGQGEIVDENGDPLVQYHFSPKEFEVFDLNKTSRTDANGMGAHFGTLAAAQERQLFHYLDSLNKEVSKQSADYVKLINESSYPEENKQEIIDAVKAEINKRGKTSIDTRTLLSFLQTDYFYGDQNAKLRNALFALVDTIATQNNIELDKGSLYSVFLNNSNLLEMPDEGDHFLERYRDNGTIETALKDAGITDPELAKNIQNLQTAEELNTLLNKYGFDGIIYENMAEDAGSTSYLISQRNRIKSINSSEFGKSNNMYFQENMSVDDIKNTLKDNGLLEKKCS
jgi:hypothetical protein